MCLAINAITGTFNLIGKPRVEPPGQDGIRFKKARDQLRLEKLIEIGKQIFFPSYSNMETKTS